MSERSAPVRSGLSVARFRRRMRNRAEPNGLVRGGALLAAALGLMNLLGYLLNLVASRLLGPREFGAFAALLGIVLVANVGALALQSVTARRLAADGPGATPALLRLGRHASLLIGGGLAAATPALSRFLHIDAVDILLVAAAMVPMTVVGSRLGLAQGAERFGVLATLYVVVAIGKLGGALAGLAVHADTRAGLIGMLAGSVAATITAALLMPDPHSGVRQREPGASAELLTAAGALFAFFTLINVDVLLARHHLGAEEAGLYALGAVIAKGTFWFPQFVAVLTYPMLVDQARRGRAIRLSLLLTLACGVVVTVFTALFGAEVVRVVGGSEYAALADEAALFALAGSLFAVVHLLVYARLAQGDPRAGVSVAAVTAALIVAVQVGAHESVTAIVLSVCVAAGALSLAGVAGHRREFNATAAADPPPTH